MNPDLDSEERARWSLCPKTGYAKHLARKPKPDGDGFRWMALLHRHEVDCHLCSIQGDASGKYDIEPVDVTPELLRCWPKEPQ